MNRMNGGALDVQNVAKRVGITNEAVVRKAEEYVRLAKVRCPQGLGASENCKTIACLGLACKMLGEPFNKEAALKATKNVDKLYSMAISSLQNILNVRPELTAEQLATKFGVSAKLTEDVVKTLSKYKEEFVAGLSPLEKGCVNFSSVAYLVVAFYVTATSAKIPYQIDKAQLLNFADVQESEFNRIQTSMNELCFGKKSTANEEQLNDVLVEKRRREDEEELSDLEGAEEDQESELVVPGLKKSKKRQKTEEYDEWKQKILSKPKQELPKNVWRQSTLTSFVKTIVLTPKEEKELNEAKNALKEESEIKKDKNTPEAESETKEDKNTPKGDTEEGKGTNEDKTTNTKNNAQIKKDEIKNTPKKAAQKPKDKTPSKGMKKVLAESKKKKPIGAIKS